MTVSATTRKAGPYAGNDVTTAFPFLFKVFEDSDIQPVLTDLNGNATNLVLDSDYSVLLNADQDANPGGTVTYPIQIGVLPLPTGYTLTIIGGLANNQLTDITNAGRFLPQVFENALDKLTILIQQLKEVSDRTLQAAVGTTVKLLFPAPSSGKFIRWRSDLLGLENADAGTDSMTLQGFLLDSTINTRGAAMVGFNPALTYGPATVGVFLKNLSTTTTNYIANIADSADVAKGTALIGYKLNATGAVGRTLSNKLREIVSVKDFGAVGDGVANDTAAIQAALTSLTIGGGTVLVPRGVYRYSALTLPPGVDMAGDGFFASLMLCTATTGDTVTVTSASTIRGLGFTYLGTPTGGCTIRLLGNRCSVIDCEITKYFVAVIWGTVPQISVGSQVVGCSFRSPTVAAGTGCLFLQHFSNAIVRDCIIAGPSPGVQPDSGLRIHNGDTAFITDTNITLHGFALLMDVPVGQNAYAVRMSGCLFDSAGTISGAVSASSGRITPSGGVFDMVCTNCWFGLSNAASGLDVTTIGGGTVNGLGLNNCQFPGNAQAGVSLLSVGVVHTVITGGYASGNPVYGLRVAPGVGNFNISGFVAANIAGRGANGRGIDIDTGGSDNYVIVGCRSQGSSVFNFFDGGSGTTKVVANNLTT